MSATQADPANRCALLGDAEVRALLPGVGAGEPERTREKYGITACLWSSAEHRFGVQVWKAGDASAEDELRGLLLGAVDPLDSAAKGNIRVEPVDGVGDAAFVAVEAKDPSRGIINDLTLLVARKGDRILVLQAGGVPGRSRDDVMQSLHALGASAASRL